MAFGFGIVGCGMIAHFHARAVGDIRGASVVACYDTVPAAAERFAQAHGLHCLSRSDSDDGGSARGCGDRLYSQRAHLEPAVAAAKPANT